MIGDRSEDRNRAFVRVDRTFIGRGSNQSFVNGFRDGLLEAVAMDGTGVFDTLKAVAKQVLTELRKS